MTIGVIEVNLKGKNVSEEAIESIPGVLKVEKTDGDSFLVEVAGGMALIKLGMNNLGVDMVWKE